MQWRIGSDDAELHTAGVRARVSTSDAKVMQQLKESESERTFEEDIVVYIIATFRHSPG